ncbi:hypothetical protein UFOVP1290_439 [uncultured Caudovirales phage]|uniref:DUF1360 domain-containing protein n=1 Tax=uncultured Caudovirales phage TaxID=2100421 RepID=A0A6J5RIU7_9CAUD|nr:hypothetical protein UFOVP1290_439 [uncultured Caudovirales phage]
MLNTIIIVFSIFSLSFLIKESDGPWGLMAWFRNKLISNKYVGVFFYNLLSCYFCLGMHSGYIIYLIGNSFHTWTINNFILWSLAGGGISFIINIIIGYLTKE